MATPATTTGAESLKKINISFTAALNAPKVPSGLKRSEDTTVLSIQRELTKKLKASGTVYLFISKAQTYFMPNPDQTVGNLFELFGEDDVLKFTYAFQVFQG